MITVYGWRCAMCGFSLKLKDPPTDEAYLHAVVHTLLASGSDFVCPECERRELEVVHKLPVAWTVELDYQETLNALSGLGLPSEQVLVNEVTVVKFFEDAGLSVDTTTTPEGRVILQSIEQHFETGKVKRIHLIASGSGAVVRRMTMQQEDKTPGSK